MVIGQRLGRIPPYDADFEIGFQFAPMPVPPRTAPCDGHFLLHHLARAGDRIGGALPDPIDNVAQILRAMLLLFPSASLRVCAMARPTGIGKGEAYQRRCGAPSLRAWGTRALMIN